MSKKKIIEQIFLNPRVSVGELTKTLNLSTKVIRNYLDNLRIDGFIEREGSKKMEVGL